jgi:hypothetical protein
MQGIQDHYLILTGEHRGILATSKNLRSETRYICQDILLKLVQPPKGLIAEGSLTIDQYLKTVADSEFKSESFFIEDVGKKIRIASKKSRLFSLIRRIIADPNYPYPFYFIFTNRDQMIKFMPVSSEYFLDSYYIYYLENEEGLRQTLLSSSKITVKNILNLCYAIIPTQNAQANYALNIISDLMSDDEFRILAELSLEAPEIRQLTDKENAQIFYTRLSCAIPLYNNPKAKLA